MPEASYIEIIEIGGLDPKSCEFERIRAQESVSSIPQFHIKLVTEEKSNLLEKLIEKRLVFALNYKKNSQVIRKRFVNGYIVEASMGHYNNESIEDDLATYHLTVCPWLWFLQSKINSKIFQKMTTKDIISKVFNDASFDNFKFKLETTSPEREYCVQYRESDFNFISRLLEEEGIYYYFEYEEKKHTLILSDNKNYQKLPHNLVFSNANLSDTVELGIITLQEKRHITVNRFETADYNYLTPNTKLNAESKQGRGEVHPTYEYPGDYEDLSKGNKIAQVRLEAYQANHIELIGESHDISILPGYKFTLDSHPMNEFNRSYIITQAEWECSSLKIKITFHALPDNIVCRPLQKTPKPTMVGPETAVVTGRKGEEIYTDEYGRIKIQFHWDKDGKKDENSSCWVRVMQNWAGRRWGVFFLPRIGQEVVVSFINGDPDRPLVVGCVYNEDFMPPYDLPEDQTKSGIKTRTSQGGGESDCNEIRFEDKKDNELFFAQAQKDFEMNVKNDYTNTIKKNRTVIINEENDTLKVEQGNRNISVKGNEKHETDGDYTLEIGGNLTISVRGDIKIEASNINSKAKLNIKNEGTNIENKAITELKNSALNISNKGNVGITNEAVRIESKATAQHTVQSLASMQVQGTILSVTGNAIAELKGPLVKIN